MPRYENVFCEHGGKFLAPDDVGSAVQWRFKVDVREHNPADARDKGNVSCDGTIYLSDCNRGIQWSFDPADAGAIEKLDAAILELKRARAALVRAQRIYNGHRKRMGLED
jgi:hypothetical protein